MIYELGILVSLFNIVLLSNVVHKQFKELRVRTRPELISLKKVLLSLAIILLFANIYPVVYDIIRLLHPIDRDDLSNVYSLNNYVYRLLAAVFMYLIYKY